MIVPILDRLHVGNLEGAHSAARAGYVAVLSITPSSIGWKPKHHAQLKIDDGIAWDDAVQRLILSFIASTSGSGTVLVHCDVGVSRSVCAVILWLMALGFSKEDALDYILKKHPDARPHPTVFESLEVPESWMP